jgi:hypothetical protein
LAKSLRQRQQERSCNFAVRDAECSCAPIDIAQFKPGDITDAHPEFRHAEYGGDIPFAAGSPSVGCPKQFVNLAPLRHIRGKRSPQLSDNRNAHHGSVDWLAAHLAISNVAAQYTACDALL